MKEMKYSYKRKREVLATGYSFGILYFVMNLGTHPTAYIKLPDNANIDYGKIDELDVHGGITYNEGELWITDNKKIEGHFVGWDYAHFEDYEGYDSMLPLQFRTNGKKWTTEEILEDVKRATYEVNKMLGGYENGRKR